MSESCHLVIFTLDDQRYALHLSAVDRTVRMVEITPLPKAPGIVLGVISVNGMIVPVLDIRRRFALPERKTGLGDHLVIARTAKRTVALAVNGVHEVIERPAGEIIPPEAVLPGMEHVHGVVKLEDGMVFIHDLDGFLSLEEEQVLDAAMEQERHV
ncbi:CheW protein [Geobacter metallireducens RCH3]|uniref:chemotaxis protein CheW n=1 Tax=Geobacter metallireducens TaxID=28232 RepID=UPI00024A2849|nr:chemotaxis protein CheW [Geobacter metallireducens]EHP88941.1 CheW protein [Geobacter metallireducens RCH3]